MSLFSFHSVTHACEQYLLDTSWTFGCLLDSDVPGTMLAAGDVPATIQTRILPTGRVQCSKKINK